MPRERKRDRLKRVATVPLAVRTSDLPVRVGSAAVMLAITATAFALGGEWWRGFIALVALATIIEFTLLVVRATANIPYRLAALLAGIVYIGVSAALLANQDPYFVIVLVVAVIFTDTGAYFAGRTIGGPKIAPRISPSKTWAGLAGGMVAAAIWLAFVPTMLNWALSDPDDGGGAPIAWNSVLIAALIGAALAIVAQAGDFFESWLKRKAGVKDSSRLIPGHGGVFDRVDGLVSVSLVIGLFGGWVGL